MVDYQHSHGEPVRTKQSVGVWSELPLLIMDSERYWDVVGSFTKGREKGRAAREGCRPQGDRREKGRGLILSDVFRLI